MNIIAQNIYKYEFRKKCYDKCPNNTENMNYYCDIKCPKEYPFEIKETQQCVSNCSIIERKKNYVPQNI